MLVYRLKPTPLLFSKKSCETTMRFDFSWKKETFGPSHTILMKHED